MRAFINWWVPAYRDFTTSSCVLQFTRWIAVLLREVFEFTTHILTSIENLLFKILHIEDLHHTIHNCTRWNGGGMESLGQVTSEVLNLSGHVLVPGKIVCC